MEKVEETNSSQEKKAIKRGITSGNYWLCWGGRHRNRYKSIQWERAIKSEMKQWG